MNIRFLFIGLLFLMACNSKPSGTQAADPKATAFGAAIADSSGMLPAQALNAYNQGNVAPVVLRGKVNQVCQSEGCWFNMDIDSTRKLFIDFNHAFTVPKKLFGKTVLAAGSFYQDTISVASLRERAKDAEKTEAEINAITLPLIEVNFRATGVRIIGQ